MQQQPEELPKVYSAIYSGVPVYESLIANIPVMRRMADNYLNATQILKVCGFSKPQRTKILEQEILLTGGTHEKIQGGYGKYQGTWIPLEDGILLAEKYGVRNTLEPILDFNPAEDPVGTKPISKRVPRVKGLTATGELDGQARTPVRSRAASVVTPAGSPARTLTATRQEPTPISREFVRERQFTLPISLNKRMFDEDNARKEFFESVYSRKRIKTVEIVLTPVSSVVENEIINEEVKDVIKFDDQKMMLMHIFVNEDTDYNCSLFEQMLTADGSDAKKLVLQLGAKKGTLLHWAAAYSRIKLVKLFISKGIEIGVVNENGLTPLMEALSSTRAYANQSMDDLLNLLGPSLMARDKEDRNALHYVNDLSKYRSKQKVSTYYMESIARYIEETRMAVGPTLSAFVDAQDKNLNTALHLACYNRHHKNAFLLLKFGASTSIENNKKETAKSISAYDFRLVNLLQFEHTGYLMDTDDYDDAPTTPMSDVTDFSSSTIASNLNSNYHLPAQKIRQIYNTHSSQNLAHDQYELEVIQTARHLQDCKQELQELKYYRDRMSLVEKHVAKIKKTLDQSSNNVPVAKSDSAGSYSSFHAPTSIRERTTSQRTMMAETKLSSQLIRLESLIKASIEEQHELVAQIEGFKVKREAKDARYNSMLATVCKVKDVSRFLDSMSE